jgi:hypothetical protein
MGPICAHVLEETCARLWFRVSKKGHHPACFFPGFGENNVRCASLGTKQGPICAHVLEET